MSSLARIDTREILERLGYDYYSYVEPPAKPELAEFTFDDLIPRLPDLSGRKLYRHQVEALEALNSGRNVILKSGTGSGKTEAWLLFALKNGIPTLAVYPTLALANDQIRRIQSYSQVVGSDVEVIDALRRDQLLKVQGRTKLRASLSVKEIIVTNPAFLLHEVKKMAVSPRGSLLDGFLHNVKLIVLDEIDFYGPREIALLLALVDILSKLLEPNFQLAALTATIENPEELAEFFTMVNGRETSIIVGPPFRVENRVYIVLGRNLQSLWRQLREQRDSFLKAGVGEDVAKALDDFTFFKSQVYRVVEAARAIGLQVPPLDPDPIEILKSYVYDSGVTLVFTRGIAKAEELARKLRASLEGESAQAVAAHHHLASKEYRAIVEEGARTGRVKVLISPRTLSQGIDIGTVVRIVHVGLPESLREFYQREGRKGRREELGFSETVIIPGSKWDRDILSRGVEALKSWLQMPIEKVIINPQNKYLTLFEALLKFISPKLRQLLTKEELSFLEKLGLVKRGELTQRGKEAWLNMNFYEFAPPYGINRILEVEDGFRYLESISHCDLVEKFQPGCIDYTADGIVVEHRLGGRTGRIVTAVVEEELREANLWRRDALAQALEEYQEAKIRWGEPPNLLSDYLYGRLHSEVRCVVYPPRRGFGRYIKIPNRVLWRVISTAPRVKRMDGKTITFRDFRVIEVPTPTYGKYSDYTYGMLYELDPAEDVRLIRIGLALLMIVLRKKLRIPFETIMYDVGKVGEKKFMGLHEPESAGLLEKLDWLQVKKLVEEYQPEELDEVLMESFDEYTYADFITLGLDWEQAKRFALRVLDYILLEESLLLKVKGVELSVPKPSKALKLASFDVTYVPLMEKADTGLICVGVFDGESCRTHLLLRDFSYTKDASRVDQELSQLVNEGFTLLVYDLPSMSRTLEAVELRLASLLFRSLREEGKLIDVKGETQKILEVGVAPLEEVEKIIEYQRSTSISDVLYEAANSQKRISQAPPGKWHNFTKFLGEKLEAYAAENCKSIYLLHLALQALKRKEGFQ